MKTLSAISKVLLANNIDKKLTKRRTDYLLGVLALAALPHEAIASKETPQTVDIKGYLVDVAKLAEAAGIEITDIDQVALALDDVTLGELIYLGNGVYQFIPTEGVSGGVSFVISGSGASQAVTVVASFDQATAMDGGIVAFVGFDVSDYQSSLPEFSYSSAKSDSDSSSDEGSSFGGAGYGLAALAAGVGMAMGSSSEDESTETVDGVILDGYLSNAQVFLDANSNGNLDWTDSITVNGQWDAGEGEQWTLSGVDGSYSLENVATSDIASGTLVGRAYKIDSVSQTVDMVSGSSVDNIVLKADASATVITPITTLIEAGVEETLILEVLGLSEAEADVIGSINSYDPFADEIANSLDATVTDAALAYGKVAAQVFTSINAIAEAVDSAADTTAADEVFVTAITQLAEIIEEEVLVREENTLIEAQAVALQAIVDAAGAEATDDQINAVAEARATKTAEIEVDLADSTVIQEVATQTISVVDAITGNSEVADNFAYNATLAADIYQAVANINEQIDSIVEFNEDATATLSIGADALVDQVKEAVEKEVLTKEVAELDEIIASGDAEDQAVIDAQTAKSEKETELTSIGDAKITLAADTFVSFYESSSALHTQFDVEGTDSNSTVDATGTYGDLQNNGGGEWLYVAHTANDHGRSQNDGDTYTEHFVITDDNATTHEVTVVVYGANDSAVISADSPAEAIVEGDTDSDVTVSGVASHTDIDGDNADDTFTAVTDVATTYGAYSVTAGGAWTYTLNSTNATIDALGQGQSTSDTVTVTAEDGTTKDITIAINGTNDAADITVVDSSVSENNTVVESSNVISSENVFQLNGSQAILNDYDPSSDTDIQKIITMSSYGSTLFAENTTSLNLGNLLNAANNSQEFQAQTISFELAKIPTGSGSGTVGIDLIDGSDEIVDSGERFAHLDINVDWSADGDSAQFTVPSQTVSGFYITSAGSQIDFTIENAEPDMISVTHNGANYPASIDLKFASIIDSLEGVGSVSLLEAGTYSVALTTDLPIVDSSGTHIDTIASVVEITNDASVTIDSSVVLSSENVFQLNGSQAILNDYDPSSDTDIQKIITMSSYGSTLFAENTTSLNLGNLLNAANNSQEFQAQTISFELAKIPTGSGSGTVGIDLIDGSDEIVDSGERFAHLDINVDWSADGDSAQFTVPSQTVSGFYITSAGSQIDFTIENAEPDMISVTHNGANYPASIDLKFASIIDSLEGVGSVSLLEAGTYSVALTTDLPIVDSSGTHIDTIASVVEITNDASVELISSGSTFADSTVSGTVTHTDVDANNADDAFTAVADIATTFGAYSVTTGGAWTYTLNNNIATIDELGVGQSVTDIVTVTAEDGTTKDITITINGINDSAFVSGDFGDFIVENDVDVSGTLYHTDIDANNADDTFTAVADVATTYGTYSVTTGGAWTYTLDNNNAAINSLTDSDEVADTFVVTAEDGTAEDVMIQIIGANDAPTSSPISDVVVDEDVALDALDVTSYFADVDAGDTLSYTADFGEGSMVLADGIVPGNTFDNDGVGVHNVTITATDSSNVTASESFTITVNNVNDAAVITAADGTIAEGDATVSGSATHTDVDANNADDTFTAVTDVATTYGTYSVTAGGAWTYTLNNENAAIDALAASASLADTITVTAEDGTTKDVTITITGVNDAPVITSSATASAPENGTVAMTITATDVDSGSISYSISGTDAALFSIDESSGALTFNSAPDYELQDPVANDNTYNLTVSATDGSETTTQEVAITVTNVEGGPVFSSAETISVSENQTAVVTLTASDDENDTIAFSITGGDDQDSFDLADGVLTFKEAPNYEVKASYTLTVAATEVGTDALNSADQTITVSVTDVNDAPTSSPISDVVVDEDVALDALDVTSYFADVDAGDTLSYTADFGEGSMVLADGIVPGNTFDNDGVGVHNVTITATDSSNVTASESFTITVNNVNDAAVITAADGTIAEGDATVSGSATHTDVDANNADDTFTAVTDVATTYGTYSVTAGGAWTYTLNNENAAIDALAASASLADTITVTAEDGTTKDVTITITGVNDAPVGVADSLTISEDAAATVISVLSNDTDAEDSALSVVFKTAGSNGTVVNVGDGTVTYEPNANFSGSDTFTYIASDGTEQSELTTVTVTVDAVNDPTTGSVTISGDAKTGQVLTASNTLADDDGLGTVTYQWYKDGTEVSDAVNATYTLSDSDIGGVFTVTASHTDDGGTTESADSDATGAVADIDKPFVFNAEVIEASAITTSSIGSYVDNPTEKIIKLTLDVDMARISDDSVNSITAGSLDFVIDWSKVEAISYLSGAYQDMYIEEATPVTATSFSGDSVAVTTFSGLTYDGSASDTQFNEVLISSIDVSANVPNLTLVDDVDTTPGNPFAAGVDHASSNDLWTFYLNPVDSIDSLDITFGGGVTINEGDSDITQLSYTTTVDIL